MWNIFSEVFLMDEENKILEVDKSPLPLYVPENEVKSFEFYNPNGKLWSLENRISCVIKSPDGEYYLPLDQFKWLDLNNREVIDAPFYQTTLEKKHKGWEAYKITHLEPRREFEKISDMLTELRNGGKGSGIYYPDGLPAVEETMNEWLTALHKLASEAIMKLTTT